MEKKEKIIIIAVVAIAAIVFFLLYSKKKDQENENTIVDALQSASDAVKNAAQSNSETAKTIQKNNESGMAIRWLTAGSSPNEGETVYLAPNTADSLDIRNNNVSKNIDYKMKNENDDGTGMNIGTFQKQVGSLYWKMKPSTEMARKTDYLIKYGFYTNAGNYLYVRR